jgi:putative DNA primase/helicase
MLEAALSYARRGWAVVPLHSPRDGHCDCNKPDCRSPAKHPRTMHGLDDATTDEATVTRWWSTWPDANIGIVTGAKSGLVAIDVDPKDGGDEAFAEISERLPLSLETVTGSGGRHVLLRHPGGKVGNVTSKNGKAPLGKGIDVRADGGYIVAPPSLHVSGKRYKWDQQGDLADMPAWLVETLAKPEPAKSEPAPDRIAEGSGRWKYLLGMGSRMRLAGASLAELEVALLECNRLRNDPPYPDYQVKRIAQFFANKPAGSSYATPQPEGAPPAAQPSLFNHTDYGNAERMAKDHGEEIRYCHPWKRWLVWDGRRWCLDDSGEVQRRAKLTARMIYAEAAGLEDEKRRKATVKHGLDTESGKRLSAMTELTKSEPGIPVRPEDLDADQWVLTVDNGLIDLLTGELREHDRAALCTKLVPIAFDSDATCPTWEKFVLEIMGGDAELASYLQRAVGYALTGSIREQVFFVLHGAGSNGKSTFLEVLRELVGDYAKAAATETFLAKKYDADKPRNDLAVLKGARLVTAVEIGEGKRLDEPFVKAVTGGDTVSCRFLYGEQFDMRPIFKLFLATNHKPEIRGTDNGIWRRVHLVPFLVSFEGRADKDLPAKLRAELPGILTWAVNGCLDWIEGGLRPPPQVLEATADYRAEMDVLADFLGTVLDPRGEVQSSALYKAYANWCDTNGERANSQSWFSRRLKERGYKSRKTNGNVVWEGMSLPVPDDVYQGG